MTVMTTPLGAMSQRGPSVLWNDSADPSELAESISFGAVGATCNPVIALAAIRADLPRWTARIKELAEELPEATESEIGWKVVEEVSLDAAKLLEPAFERYNGYNGRLSMQTDPRLARSATKLADQAVYFSSLAKNIIVKVPAIETGVAAIEDATYRGVSINVTVSFTVAQAVATGEAIERGLKRREAEGLDTATMGPVVTIMVGRLDDWMKDCFNRAKLAFDPGYLEWAGVAAFKKAYAEFQARGLRARLLSAAFRNTMHWSEFVGGNVVISPPFSWQKRIQNSDLTAEDRMDVPVNPQIVDTLYAQLPEFRQAYDVDGLTPAQFIEFGATRKTLRQFLGADEELDHIVRDILIPAP
ncbi:MAG: transaldolase family protein [Propionicimonas sp.]|uniref:transaldolase family protein n=1 Tax=Propionicimonas sp. TaxID=1955623 RepID=UPI002B1F1339|nr:transaldolase family protein [Propionicimonas sp.]MEA4943793.1 transaldolase family protein [Propionicimonas sp.]MEA5055794.1 transaldolase family protein [Propionicimonas sp.]MEA5118985.1 transaldolase family protein [Propionicimonas sp.]